MKRLCNVYILLFFCGYLSLNAQNQVADPMKDVNLVIDHTLDSINKVRTVRPEAGSTRKGDNPVLFLVGNSTMRTGTLGNGNNGQCHNILYNLPHYKYVLAFAFVEGILNYYKN